MTGDPLGCYRHWRDGQDASSRLLLVEFCLDCYWLDESPTLALTALYCLDHGQLRISVSAQSMLLPDLPMLALFEHLLSNYSLIDYRAHAPLALAPTTVSKPWGQEVWYTGVERRGVCEFRGENANVPIPWLQAAVPDYAAGDPSQPLVLLKILDPRPQTVLGDLYFELHEHKREVYVVTSIDTGAWPGGTGGMRFGFNPGHIATSASREQFRADYLAAVQDYERVRRAIDSLPEHSEAPAELLAAEVQLRGAMDDYTDLRPIAVGDVIVVPPRVPHSLQHGVKVIEFQTPVYERQILSFAQRVLTQEHWDTSAAVASMRLDAPTPESIVPLPAVTFRSLERIADFPEFELLRATLDAGERWQFERGSSYSVAIVACGSLRLAGRSYEAEEALLLPAGWAGELAAPESASPLVLLIARSRS